VYLRGGSCGRRGGGARKNHGGYGSWYYRASGGELEIRKAEYRLNARRGDLEEEESRGGGGEDKNQQGSEIGGHLLGHLEDSE